MVRCRPAWQAGICQFTIDPVAAFGTEQIALANFKVKLTVSDASADSQDVLYKIIDLTTETRPALTFVEKVEGCPDRSIFFNGKLVVPCGYAGVLRQK